MTHATLNIYLGSGDGRILVGALSRYENDMGVTLFRFVPDDAYAARSGGLVLSASMIASSVQLQRSLWADASNPLFNGSFRDDGKGESAQLPAFFQNLLPEGMLRDLLAAQRGCDRQDHFELLAACGQELPGNVYALPTYGVERTTVPTQTDRTATVSRFCGIAGPMKRAASLSGVQPKLALVKKGSRYVGRGDLEDTNVIVKLPNATWPLLPELEELSLRLAQACGIPVVTATLDEIGKLDIDHGFDLGDSVTDKTLLLAVDRFDRVPGGRVHCEDFAQVLNAYPGDKYKGTYLDVAMAMIYGLEMSEDAVYDLLRRLVVNELIGNADMHLKNIGVMYPDGVRATLSPAYDIVGFAAYSNITGHGLKILPNDMLPTRLAAGHKQQLSPAVVRAFCAGLNITERPAAAAITDAVGKAASHWPEMIRTSAITSAMKDRLLVRLEAHPMTQSWRRRRRQHHGPVARIDRTGDTR